MMSIFVLKYCHPTKEEGIVLGIVTWFKWLCDDIRPFDVLLWKTNDIDPYEWTPESTARFNALVSFWKKSGPFRIVLSGGLPNKSGITIAQTIRERIQRELPEAVSYILEERDDQSNDTAAEVRYVEPIFRRYCSKVAPLRPRMWVLSNYWHLRRLWVMFAYKGIWARNVVSPTSGGWSYRFKRFLNEIVLLGITIVDPKYQLFFFEKERKRRMSLAASRDIREP